jgi:hypothetical protein
VRLASRALAALAVAAVAFGASAAHSLADAGSPPAAAPPIAQGACRVIRHNVVRLRSLSLDANATGRLVTQAWALDPATDRHGMLARALEPIASTPTVSTYSYHGTARSFDVQLTIIDSAGLSATSTIRCATARAQRKPSLVLTLPAARFFKAGAATLTPRGLRYLRRRIRRLVRHDLLSARAVSLLAPRATRADSKLALARAQAVLATLGLRSAGRTTVRGPSSALGDRAGSEQASVRKGALPAYGPCVRLVVAYARP